MQAINDEALAFQREKQARLNQVEVVLLLRLHQIEYLQDGQLPSDLSGALLFSNTELDKLKHRVHVSFFLGLLLGTEAPVMTPNGVDFSFFEFLMLSVFSALRSLTEAEPPVNAQETAVNACCG